MRWGFLGAGSIARDALAPAVAAARGAQLQAVAARDLARARDLAGQYAAPASYGSYAELLADRDVDAVYISLPNDLHAPWTLAALDAGKHVLCEKPFAMTAAEVDGVAGAAARTNRLAVEASWYRWHPRVRHAQRLLAEGAIGAVRQVSAGFTFDGVADGNYRLETARGGGALYDVGCYAVSAVVWAFAGQSPQVVSARQELGSTGVDLSSELVLDFADGGTGQVRAGMAHAPQQWLVISGDRGEIVLRDQPFTASSNAEVELWLSDGRDTQRLRSEAVNPYVVMVEEFASVAAGGEGWVLPLAESRVTAAVIDAAFASARAGGEPTRLGD